MNLLRCATHIVADLDSTTKRFEAWLDYRVAERGTVAADLAAAWGSPASAGRCYAVCRPASGRDVFLRFIEGDAVADYRPIRSFGWAAIEICVQDVDAVHARMAQSPFDVIGPPTRIAGIPEIYPMQVRGPDQETVYFTEITTQDLNSGLPHADSPIDSLFIVVLACRDMAATAAWFAQRLQLTLTPTIAIRYRMISQAFGLPITDLHEIATAKWDTDFFLEFDQYPAGAVERPTAPGALPPGVSICTLYHPALDSLDVEWESPPVVRAELPYAGRRVGVVRTPEGALLEIVAAD